MSKVLDFLLGRPEPVEDQLDDAPPVEDSPAFEVRLSPDAVRRTEFSAAPLGRRGYDPAEVDAFRLRVARALETGALDLEDAVRRARVYESETRRLRDVYRVQNSDLAIPSTPAMTALQDAIEIVARAEQTGDQIVRQATLQAQMLVNTARSRYAQIIRNAEEEAERALADVRAGGGNPDEERHLQDTILTLRAIAQSTKGQLEGALREVLAELEGIEILPLPDGSEPARAR